jgi:hypothetical protein
LRADRVSRAAALGALIALVLGPLVAGRSPRVGRILGIHGFLGLSLVAWILLARAGVSLAPEPLRGALGALGFMLYAFGWGELRASGAPEDDPHAIPGEVLAPRVALSRAPMLVLGLAASGAVAVQAVAFWISRPAHAVMGHGLAVAAALFVVGAGVSVALSRAPRRFPPASDRLRAAVRPLSLLLIVLGLGLLWRVLGR